MGTESVTKPHNTIGWPKGQQLWVDDCQSSQFSQSPSTMACPSSDCDMSWPSKMRCNASTTTTTPQEDQISTREIPSSHRPPGATVKVSTGLLANSSLEFGRSKPENLQGGHGEKAFTFLLRERRREISDRNKRLGKASTYYMLAMLLLRFVRTDSTHPWPSVVQNGLFPCGLDTAE